MSRRAKKLLAEFSRCGLRVLCVDDAEPALALRALILEAKGYAVTISSSALQVAETFESGKFDLAVLDYEMPAMNGVELAARLKAACPELKTILYTGASYVIRHDLPFIDATVDKSDGVEELLAAIEAFLPRRQEYPQLWRTRFSSIDVKREGEVRMQKRSFRFRFGLATLSLAILAIVLVVRVPHAQEQSTSLAVPPVVRSHNGVASLTLHAVRGSDGRDSFAFNGKTVPPIIRVSPGDTLKFTYVNDLPKPSGERCSVGSCMNMTNLHFHGLGVSPKAPEDDVLDMIAMPGQTLKYTVHIPAGQEPGLYWYHTHPHGESEQQVLDGMSGAIIVEGMERYVPVVRGLPERIIILRGPAIRQDANGQAAVKKAEAVVNGCGNSEAPERVLTINGDLRPTINIAPGERQFWRIVNASADRYADVQLDGEPWQIVALDGMPLAYHDPDHPVRVADHVLLPPASRLEAIVTGPPAGSTAKLRTRCIDAGPDGDPTPAMVLADIVPRPSLSLPIHMSTLPGSLPTAHAEPQLASLESSQPQFVATFTEDKKSFYINGQRYEPDAAPMTEAQVGTYQHWRVVNQTKELHPMHLHQVHFLVYTVNGTKLANPEWLDTANVPYGGSIDMIVDFTNPVIRGMSVFHCHLLNHEDKGMMAKILLK